MRRHHRWLVPLALLCVSFGASAQPEPKRTRRPAASHLGAGKDDDEPSARPTSRGKGPTADDDQGLMRALLFAFEPAPQEIRVIAVEDLGLLGDSRTLNPLSQILFDLNPAVQQAALRSIARYQHPRAEEILCNVVRHPLLPERLKVRALDALVLQRSPTAREFLTRVQGNGSVAAPLRDAARKALADFGPTTAAR